MKRLGLFFSGVALAAATSAQADGHREMAPHVHGTGALNIALEGSSVMMELEVPGADIVGFEHAATSPEDRARVDAAVSDLSDPMGLFVFPAGAGCTVSETHVELAAEGEDHDADQRGHEDHDHADGGGHSAFHTEYTLTCSDPGALDRLDFAYFSRFAGARELDVQIISDKGAHAFEIERDHPRLDLRGLN